MKEQTFAISQRIVIYSCQNDLKTILEDLRYDVVTLLRWFKENSMKANPKKNSIYDTCKTPRQPIMLNINKKKGRRISKSSSTVSYS